MKKIGTLFLAAFIFFPAISQNRALHFDGINDYVTIPDKTGVLKGNNFTVEFWIKPSTTSDVFMLIDKMNQSTFRGIQCYLYMDACLIVDVNTNLGSNSIMYTLPVSWVDNWHHVAITYNGSTLTLFAQRNCRCPKAFYQNDRSASL